MPPQSSGPSWSELRKELLALEKLELIALIQDLYKLNNDNKLFLATRFTETDLESLAEPYRKIIAEQFNPRRGFPKLGLRVARKAVTDIKKAANNPVAVIDMMLYYVEQGVICTKNYGDIDEPFYSSHVSMFESAVKLIRELNDPAVTEQFRYRAQKIVRDTSGIGWGFHDDLAHLYRSEYPSVD